MDIMNLNNLFLTIERGDPLKRQDQTTLRNMVHLGLLKCGKVGNGEHDRSGKPEQNSWDSLERVDPLRGEHLLGRNCAFCKERRNYSRKNGETRFQRIPRERLILKSFIVGSDTTEFVNKVRNQVRIRQKRMSSNAEDCTEHSITWGMFMATTLNAATIHGKELFHDAKCCAEWRENNIETNV